MSGVLILALRLSLFVSKKEPRNPAHCQSLVLTLLTIFWFRVLKISWSYTLQKAFIVCKNLLVKVGNIFLVIVKSVSNILTHSSGSVDLCRHLFFPQPDTVIDLVSDLASLEVCYMPDCSFLWLKVLKLCHLPHPIFEHSDQNFPFLGLILRFALATSGNVKLDTGCKHVWTIVQYTSLCEIFFL